ncbi:basic secretory protein-like protein [Mycolicibacterium brumae]|uniref:basic secretory protein-like protein n=1 Tax=Mycolicibacterium brumae TaxID=85968 RepID=UPI000A9B0133|nr:basic secretory protein-like protein [Mycolicibacterium brumae]RWA19445.1 hypothetical protein MBRU_16970 [Mycolicibacterium brumae DSM 44177]UWW08363.1 hypothetical protein L2Z93_001417 [Mycolicibacterium brumae]
MPLTNTSPATQPTPAHAGPAQPAPATSAEPRVIVGGREIVVAGTPNALTDRAGAHLPAAIATVERFWGPDWPRQIVVQAAPSDTAFAELTRIGPDAEHIAAAAVAEWVDPSHGIAVGQRIVLAPGASALTDDDFQLVLTHELFHYATRADTALDAPRWVQEGVADYVARPAPTVSTTPTAPDRLPEDADFAATEPAELSVGYDRAWLFARFIAQRYGSDRLRELYRRAAGPGHPDTATALTETLGADEDQLLADWRAHASGQPG